MVDVQHKPRGLTSLPSCHLSQVHKVQHKPTKKISWGTLQSLEQRQALVLPVAHQTVSGVHRTLSGAQAEHHTNWPLFAFPQSHSAIIHRTCPVSQRSNGQLQQRSTVVNSKKCTMQKSEVRDMKSEHTGLSGVPPDCPVRTQSNDQLRQRSTTQQSYRQGSEESLRCQIAPDCLVPQEDRRLQRSIAPTPNGRLMWNSPDREQCSVRCTTGLSGVPIDSNSWNSGWNYKYPQPPPFKLSKFSGLHIQ